MSALQEYKCPCCGGAIAFDSAVQKMKCPYCDTEFEMETLAAYDAELQTDKPDEMNWDEPAGSEWQEGEDNGLVSYVCNSCGGEIVADENTAATSCPFCGNPVVMMGRVSGMLKPDYVIPFKLDKKAAKAALTKHYSGKKLLPLLPSMAWVWVWQQWRYSSSRIWLSRSSRTLFQIRCASPHLSWS